MFASRLNHKLGTFCQVDIFAQVPDGPGWNESKCAVESSGDDDDQPRYTVAMENGMRGNLGEYEKNGDK